MKIKFEVDGRPPRKSNWGKKDADLIIKLRKAALTARKDAGIDEGYDKPVKIKLTVYATNIVDMGYKQSGDDDPDKFVGDLDSLISGVCEYLQPAPENPEITIDPMLKKGDEISHDRALIIKNDSQIIEITAKKVEHDITRYHVEIVSCD